MDEGDEFISYDDRDDERNSRRRFEAQLRRGYAALRTAHLDFSKKDRIADDLAVQALFLKIQTVNASVYMTLPSTVGSHLTHFVETSRINSAMVLSGGLVEKVLQKCNHTDHRLLICNGRAFLKVEESLGSTYERSTRCWQSACFFRKERLLVVWSGQFSALSSWADEVKNFLRQVIDPSFNVPRLCIDKDGSECLELSISGGMDAEGSEKDSERPAVYSDAILMGLSVMSIFVTVIGVLARDLVSKSLHDRQWSRIAWIAVLPLIALWIFPVFHWAFTTVMQILHACFDRRKNLPTYSGKLPSLIAAYESGLTLPHITLIVPVYKEGLQPVIMPTIFSLLRAMAYYQLYGGTANIIVSDDGLQLLGEEERMRRIKFYADHHIGWTARPKHVRAPYGAGPEYLRRGKFKKASNLNSCFHMSQLVEDRMLELRSIEQIGRRSEYSVQEQALLYENALKAVLEESGIQWADGNIRIGSYVLLMDSDSRMPRDALLHAAAEVHLTPEIALLCFLPRVMQVVYDQMENWASFMDIGTVLQGAMNARFGFVAELPGNSVFMKYDALCRTSYFDDEFRKVFDEGCVIMELNLSLRLQAAGYIVRVSKIASSYEEVFLRGVPLTLWDYLAYLEKMAYGWLEICFNPVHSWIHRGPLSPPFRALLRSSIPIAQKLWLIQRCGMHIAFGSTLPILFAAYLYLGWNGSFLPWPIETYYKISLYFLACVLTASFFANCIWSIRFHSNKTMSSIIGEHVKWMAPILVTSLGTSANTLNVCLRYFLSIDMWWGATSKSKEYGRPSFFTIVAVVSKVFRRLLTLLASLVLVISLFRFVLPDNWQINNALAITPPLIWVVAHFSVLVLGVLTEFA